MLKLQEIFYANPTNTKLFRIKNGQKSSIQSCLSGCTLGCRNKRQLCTGHVNGIDTQTTANFVGILNHSKKSNHGLVADTTVDYISKCDLDYRRNQMVRTFYNNNGGYDKKFVPFAHLVTGKSAVDFDNAYGKAIGEAKGNAPRMNGKPISAELKQAVKNYSLGGLRFVNDKNKKLYDSFGIEYGLHTKFQTIRSKTGKIKGYELVDIRFCPEKGEKNPFVRIGLTKAEDL